jgi:hypothetical protein
MQFMAECAASVSTNGANFVLLKFDPLEGHLQGTIAKELGELRAGATYRVTIEEIITAMSP